MMMVILCLLYFVILSSLYYVFVSFMLLSALVTIILAIESAHQRVYLVLFHLNSRGYTAGAADVVNVRLTTTTIAALLFGFH